MQTEPNRKGVLITIIVLLVIFVPLTVVSFVFHKMNPTNPQDKNVNHEFFFEGSLYFYDKDGNLGGTYACENTSSCGLASSVENEAYALDTYKAEENTIKPIENRYAFIKDGAEDKVILFDIKNRRQMTTYQKVNNYGIGIEGDLFIITTKDNSYGVLSLESTPKIVVDIEYDYIGIANLINAEENKIMNDIMAAKKGENWYLIDSGGAVLTEPISNEIVSYNGQNIIIKKDNGYQLIDYKNQNVLEDESYNNLSFTGKYLNVLDAFNDFSVIDVVTKKEIVSPIHIKNTDTITSQINEAGALEVIQNEKVVQTVELS